VHGGELRSGTRQGLREHTHTAAAAAAAVKAGSLSETERKVVSPPLSPLLPPARLGLRIRQAPSHQPRSCEAKTIPSVL
jgi:hypothetical protein